MMGEGLVQGQRLARCYVTFTTVWECSNWRKCYVVNLGNKYGGILLVRSLCCLVRSLCWLVTYLFVRKWILKMCSCPINAIQITTNWQVDIMIWQVDIITRKSSFRTIMSTCQIMMSNCRICWLVRYYVDLSVCCYLYGINWARTHF